MNAAVRVAVPGPPCDKSDATSKSVRNSAPASA